MLLLVPQVLAYAAGMEEVNSLETPRSDPAASSVDSGADTRGAQAPYGEAPTLAAQVGNGALPPVAERLPVLPRIIEPVEQIGVYGGTWRLAMKGIRDMGFFVRTVTYENLLSWDPQWTTVVPNVAQVWTVEEDARVHTFVLRDGMRWSDGTPFTVDDIIFAWECMNRKDLHPDGPPRWLTVGGEPAKFTKVDATTIRIEFTKSYGLFGHMLAQPSGADLVSYPEHYLRSLLPSSEAGRSRDGLDEQARRLGYDGWAHHFNTMQRAWFNPELPTLHAWLFDAAYGDAGVVTLRRNPYYWKIDTEYRQLPYIDRLVFEVYESDEEILASALAGELHMQDRHIGLPEARSAFESRADENEFDLFSVTPSLGNLMVIELNLTHPDPRMRSVFSQVEFRAALSIAIDRQRIIDEVYGGAGVPSQSAPRPESQFYNRDLAEQYTKYDPERAERLLESIGFTTRGPDGYRRGPDAEEFEIAIEVADVFNYGWPAALRYVVSDWADIGIRARIVERGWNELDHSRNHSLHDALVWSGSGGLDPILEPDVYFPAGGESGFAMRWAWWYRGSETFPSEEPPAPARLQMELYDRLRATADRGLQQALMRRILAISEEEFYSIGIVRPADGFGIVRDDFHNVPTVMPGAWSFPTPAPTNPCQYFIREE